jgi:indolepyruvate ferredoxin oxidoreductase, alpha subunit
MILDNSTTAMTGGQDHPGTGRTLSGRLGRTLDIPGICRAAGIPNVVVVNPRDLAQTEAALKEALASDEPWVIVAKCPCVLVTKERSTPLTIDQDKCVRCQLCVRIGCPAIFPHPTDDPKKPQPTIDEALCQGCRLCAQTCPKDAIVEVG